MMKSLGQRYIELNPVRANMVEHPGDGAATEPTPKAKPTPSLLRTPSTKPSVNTRKLGKRHRELFRYELDPGLVDRISQATKGNYALGSSHFGEQIAAALKQRTVPGKAGRQRKAVEPESGELL